MPTSHVPLERSRRLTVAALLATLAACGGGGGGGGVVVDQYTVGGSVSGLTGAGLVLRNNDRDSLGVSAGVSSFTFASRLAGSASYAVTVSSQPAGQTCSVSNAAGPVNNANVTTVAVACVDSAPPPPPPNSFTLGGSVSGLAGSGLVLRNGTNDVAISGNGAFTFSVPVPQGMTYEVSVATQPTNPSQTCSVAAGSGTMGQANVTNVAVTCGTAPPALYTIGGTITNLTASGLELLNNGGDSLTMVPSASGPTPFVFQTRVSGGYAVTIGKQPGTNPQNSQDCTVDAATGSGTAGTNVSNVAITCGAMGPLRLLGSNPPDGATGVARNVQPVVSFSSPVNAALAFGRFELREGREVFGNESTAVSVAGSQVTMRPARKLLPLSRFRLFVGGVEGSRGEVHDSFEQDQGFVTGDATWKGIETLSGADRSVDADVNPVGSPVAMDVNGNAIAAWVAADTSFIQVSFYRAATRTWVRGGQLGTGVAGASSNLQLAMDDAGNALLVWRQHQPQTFDPDHGLIYAARFSVTANAWTTPLPISHLDQSSAYDPVIAMRRLDGSVAVAWRRVIPGTGAHDDAVYLRTIQGLGNDWSSINGDDGRVDTPVGLRLNIPEGSIQVAMAHHAPDFDSKNVAVVWSKRSGLGSNTFVWARVVSKSGLQASGPPVALSAGDALEEIQPRVAFDSGDNVRAVWLRHDRRIDPGTGVTNNFYVILTNTLSAFAWGDNKLVTEVLVNTEIASPIVSAGNISPGLDGLGVSWMQRNAGGDFRAWASLGDGNKRAPLPGPAGYVADDNFKTRPLLARDAAGNMLAVWKSTLGNGAAELLSARYNGLDGTWAAQHSRIDTANGVGPLRAGSLAIHPERGDALVVWRDNRDANVGDVRARFFD